MDAEMTGESPAGVVGVYVDREGRVIASVSDFDQSGYGGFTLLESQERRAKPKLERAVVDAYCSHVVFNALDAYDFTEIVSKLSGMMTFIPVGHGRESTI